MFSVDREKVYTGSVREISELARRIQIHRECIAFKDEINSLMKGKETFLVDMVKSLKKVTDEWRGWKHEVFGGVRSRPYVAAIEQVKELHNWTIETFKQTTIKTKKSSESYRKFTTETLQTFIKTCNKLSELQKEFQQRIVKPLKEFFTDSAAFKYINQLDMLQIQWKELLAPGAIKAYHFSKGSVISLKEAESYESFHCFYLVLRLIPDLSFKANTCIILVQNCLDTDNSKAYKRERNFLLGVWMPRQRRKEQQIQREAKIRNNMENIISIKGKIENIKQQETVNRAELRHLENILEELLQGKAQAVSRLETYDSQREENKKNVNVILEKQDHIEIQMMQLDQKKKERLQNISGNRRLVFLPHIEEGKNIEKRNDIMSNLKMQEDYKRAYEAIGLKLATSQMRYESVENEKVKLNFALKKINKKIEETRMMMENVQKDFELCLNNKRELELELKFSARRTKRQ